MGLFTGCESKPICEHRSNYPICAFRIDTWDASPLVFDKRQDVEFTLYAKGGRRDLKIPNMKLHQLEHAIQLQANFIRSTDLEGTEIGVRISFEMAQAFRIGFSTLRIVESTVSEQTERLLGWLPIQWLSPIKPFFSSVPLKSTAAASQIPGVEAVGMQDGILYVVSSGFSGANKLWTVEKYRYQSSAASFYKLLPDYLRSTIIAPLNDRLLLSVAEGMPSGFAYLSHKPQDGSQALTVCPVQAANLTASNCQSDPQSSFPPSTRAMVVSEDRSRIVRVDATGGLFWTALSGPVATGSWKPIETAGEVFRLAMTDLDADGKSDVVAVGISSRGDQQAAAYLATNTGYIQNMTVSQQLSVAIGSEGVTALAAGDVDRDGFGDVVFAQKQKLVVLQSQIDKFKPVWSTEVDPEAGKTQIRAIAVGRLEAGIADDRQLDIVTASNSDYDSMNNLTMYLHAFRSMP